MAKGQGAKQITPEMMEQVSKKLETFALSGETHRIFDEHISQKMGSKYGGLINEVRKTIGSIEKTEDVKNFVQQIDSVMTGTAQASGKVADLIKQTGKLGFKPDEILPLIKEQKFLDVKRIVQNRAREISEEKYLAELEENASAVFVDKRFINNIKASASMTAKEKGEEYIKLINVATNTFKETANVPKLGIWDALSRGASGIEKNVGETIRYFREAGYNYPSRILGDFSDLIRNATHTRYRFNRLFTEMSASLDVLPTEKQNAIRFYIENRDIKMAKPIASHAGDKTILANPELFQTIRERYKTDLTLQDLGLANKISSALRETIWLRNQWANKQYHKIGEITESFMDYDPSAIKYADEVFKGDMGTRYFPAVPNADYKKQLLSKTEYNELSQYVQRKDSFSEMKFYERSRADGSELLKDETKRATPTEELRYYVSANLDGLIRREGDQLLNAVKIASFMPLSASKRNLKDEHVLLRSIEKQWYYNNNPKHWMDGVKEGGIKDKAISFLQAYMGVAIPTALSSPKMAFMNGWQSVFTGGQQTGYINNLKNSAKYMTVFGKEVLFNPTSAQNFLTKVAKGDMDKPLLRGIDGTFGKNFSRFVKANPELHTMIDEDQLMFLLGKKVEDKKLVRKMADTYKELATFGFSGMDKVSRAAAFYSATEHGAKALDNLQMNLKKMSTDKAVGIFAKETHLGNFVFQDMEYVLKALDVDNVKASGQEVLFRYAERAVRQQAFDYSAMGQSMAKGMAKNFHPIVGLAFTFQTYPMYFHELFAGTLRSWEMGDPRPMASLVAGGLAMYAGASVALGEDSDTYKKYKNYFIKKGGKAAEIAVAQAESMPGYVLPRVPGLSYLAVGEKLYASPAGILTPAVGLGMLGIYEGLVSASELMGANPDASPFDIMHMTAKKHAQSEIVYRKMINTSIMMKEVGLIDRDLKELLKK